MRSSVGGRRRWWKRPVQLVLAVGMLGVVCTLAFGSRAVLSASDSARSGRDRLAAVLRQFDALDPSSVDRTGLDLAGADFADAADRLDSRWLWIPKHVPWVGTQLRSGQSLAEAEEELAALGLRAVDDVDVAMSSNGSRIDRLRLLHTTMSDASATIASVDLGPTSGLVAKLATARDRLETDLADLEGRVNSLERNAAGLIDELAGERRFLVLVANNAEMRAGSGSFLSVGTMDSMDGEIVDVQIGTVHDHPVDLDLLDDPMVPVWRTLGHSTEWQILGSTPRFEWTAPVALAMWQQSTGEELDGVIAVDPVLLQELMALTGPVTVDDKRYTADTVLEQVLYGQYVEFAADDLDTSSAEKLARRDALAALAGATLRSIDNTVEETSLLSLASQAASGRRLMVWTPDHGPLWHDLGVDGSLPEQAIALDVVNLGGNKLDYWSEVFAEIASGPTENTFGHRVTVSTRVVNKAPTAAPRYVVGPYPGTDAVAGEYIGVVSLHLPATATNVVVETGQEPRLIVEDGDSLAVLVDVRIQQRDSADVIVSFDLPRTTNEVVVTPSARVPGIRWRSGERRWVDIAEETISLTD
ncbi:MAG: DUF4012 domain-containing protein [Ilumatobacteraceae bacterium]